MKKFLFSCSIAVLATESLVDWTEETGHNIGSKGNIFPRKYKIPSMTAFSALEASSNYASNQAISETALIGT